VQVVRFCDFGIVGGDGGTGNNDLGTRDVFRAMSFKGRRAQTGKPLRYGRTLQVGAGNFVAKIEQHLGNAAHADATNAHEMNALNFGKHKVNFLATDLHGFSLVNLQPRNRAKDVSVKIRVNPWQIPLSRR
jgi:hypothetical protein